jgi:hypothetical protein
MAKLLNGRLPLASGDTVDVGAYNRTVRLLELNLNAFDPSSTPQFTNAELSELKFNAGDIIWNTSIRALQVYTGTAFENISTPSTAGLVGTTGVGTVQIIANGSIVVEVS